MRRIALIVAVVLAATAFFSSPVAAASGWSTSQRVWDAAYDMPSMVVDGRGAVHIAARGWNGIWYLTNQTGRWTRTRLTRDHGSETAEAPAIARDRADGSLTVVFLVSSGDCCPNTTSLAYSTDRHGRWSAPRRIPYHSAGTDLALSVAVRHGVIAVATVAGTFDATRVTFITDATGRWTHEDIGAGTPDRWAGLPSLALDRQGRPVIAYQVHGRYPKGNAVRVARGSRRSGGFTSTRVLAVPGTMGPSLVLDAHGRPRLAVATDEGTYLARETASGWRRSRVWGDGDDPVLRLGPDGRSRIVDVRSDHRVWYGRATTAGMQRTRLTTHPARQAAFAVGPSDGRDHVVTVVGDRLWYMHSE